MKKLFEELDMPMLVVFMLLIICLFVIFSWWAILVIIALIFLGNIGE